MHLLSIDTCGSTGTVAVALHKPSSRESAEHLEILGQIELPGKTYSAQLVPSIRELLAANNTTIVELATIIVTNGPGSFTGIRIGLSTAKGLAEPTSIPILAVSRLAVLAHKAQTQSAALDASRGEFYFGDFNVEHRESAGDCSRGIESLLSRDVFLERAAALRPELAVCEPSLHALVPGATLVDPPTAIDAIHSVLARLTAKDFDDPTTLDGNYLRRSDAEIFSKPGSRNPHPAPQA